MTTEEKARHIALTLVGDDQNPEPLIEALTDMAAWQREQLTHIISMTHQEFFWLVARVRSAQTEYFKTRDKRVFRACRALEKELDKEIERVRTVQLLHAADNRENAPVICRDCLLFGNCTYVGQAACPKRALIEMNEYE